MPGFNHNNSVLRICVDSVAGQIISGRVFSQRLTQSITFSDLNDLVLQVEAVFEQQNFPQAFQRTRTFLRSESSEPVAADSPENGLDAQAVADSRGQIATFEVTVVSRRNSSWQGTVNWMDESAPREFISYLDLMKLISEKLL